MLKVTMNEIEKRIINICCNAQNKILKRKICLLSDDEIQYLLNKYNETDIVWALKRLIWNINEIPKCCICGDNAKYVNTNKFRHTCGSLKCANTYAQQCRLKIFREKYNVSNPYQLEYVKEKCKQKHIENYGVENVSQSNIIKERKKKTCIKHYNVSCGFLTENCKNAIIKKYGVDNVAKNIEIKEKMQQTCLERYGVKNPGEADVIKEKIKQTCLKRYGVTTVLKTQKLIDASHTPETIEKCFQTQKRNKTINKSKEEDNVYEKLINAFGENDVIRYHKTEQYPFFCDFYIKSLNLWIECQFAMFHNGRPYIGDEKDLNEIEELKIKSEKRKQITHKRTRYDATIDIWSIHDVKKRKIAKENNLNWIEFFNMKEFDNWLNNTICLI